jgi:hypothetical protein
MTSSKRIITFPSDISLTPSLKFLTLPSERLEEITTLRGTETSSASDYCIVPRLRIPTMNRNPRPSRGGGDVHRPTGLNWRQPHCGAGMVVVMVSALYSLPLASRPLPLSFAPRQAPCSCACLSWPHSQIDSFSFAVMPLASITRNVVLYRWPRVCRPTTQAALFSTEGEHLQQNLRQCR